jgi:S1-C subfamily serine protease
MRTLIEQGLSRIDGAASAATAEVNSRIETLASSIARQPLEMKRRMIYPVVQLRGNGTVGSGVVVRSEPVDADGIAKTYILTAYHVVHEVMDPEAERQDVVEDLRFLEPFDDRLAAEGNRAEVLAEDQELDLALLRVDLDTTWPYVAEFAARDEVSRLGIFDPVYAVGCPLGNKPLPSVGEISSQEKIVSGTNFWMVNAPTFFGNSGGGIFHLTSGRLVGISSMIYTYGKRQPMVVPHMGLFVPLDTVRSWLEERGFSHFFADGVPAGAAIASPASAEE